MAYRGTQRFFAGIPPLPDIPNPMAGRSRRQTSLHNDGFTIPKAEDVGLDERDSRIILDPQHVRFAYELLKTTISTRSVCVVPLGNTAKAVWPSQIPWSEVALVEIQVNTNHRHLHDQIKKEDRIFGDGTEIGAELWVLTSNDPSQGPLSRVPARIWFGGNMEWLEQWGWTFNHDLPAPATDTP